MDHLYLTDAYFLYQHFKTQGGKVDLYILTTVSPYTVQCAYPKSGLEKLIQG